MILYIAGYGRSGSTLLELQLAQRTNLFAAGEICNLFDFAAAGFDCTCGATVASCPLWSEVIEFALRQTGIELDAAREETLRVEMVSGEPTDLYVRLWRACFEQILTLSGCDGVIDGSKTAGGRRRLGSMQAVDLTLQVIHIVRSPAGVIDSVRSGDNRVLQGLPPGGGGTGALRGAAGWVRANRLAAELSEDLSADRSMCLAFDDLVTSPGQTVRMICERFELSHFSVEGDVAPEVGAHAIAGNRMRNAGGAERRPPRAQPVISSRLLGRAAGLFFEAP